MSYLPIGKPSYGINLNIFNSKGRLVKELINQEQSAGAYSITWNGTDMYEKAVASGVYFYVIKIDNSQSVKKMLLLR